MTRPAQMRRSGLAQILPRLSWPCTCAAPWKYDPWRLQRQPACSTQFYYNPPLCTLPRGADLHNVKLSWDSKFLQGLQISWYAVPVYTPFLKKRERIWIRAGLCGCGLCALCVLDICMISMRFHADMCYYKHIHMFIVPIRIVYSDLIWTA